MASLLGGFKPAGRQLLQRAVDELGGSGADLGEDLCKDGLGLAL